MPYYHKRKRKPRRKAGKAKLTSTSTEITSNDTFHPFPRLPIELQIQIFEMTLPEEEFIHVRGHLVKKAYRHHNIVSYYDAVIKYIRLSPAPLRLREVCQVSREIALHRWPSTIRPWSAKQECAIGFGPQDTICIDNLEEIAPYLNYQFRWVNGKNVGDWFRRVEKLVIPHRENGNFYKVWDMYYALRHFESLKSFQIAMIHPVFRRIMSGWSHDTLVEIAKTGKDGILKIDFDTLREAVVLFRSINAHILMERHCRLLHWELTQRFKYIWPEKWNFDIQLVAPKDGWHKYHY